MNSPEFEWDSAKAETNRRKHGVSFEEASTVFDDPNVLAEYDRLHSDEEDRWRVIGFSAKARLITASYTKRDEKIRLISAHRTTKAEERRYIGAN